jgi:hypothetical protein
MVDFTQADTEELWQYYSQIVHELKNRNAIRTRNVTGERGEQLAIKFYKETKGLPKLQAAPEGTKNVDALSRSGDRYAIKTIMEPNRTTGVFHGVTDDSSQKPKFEFLLVVILDDTYQFKKILEIDWETFLEHKKWHSRMKAYNISITKKLIKNSTVRHQ